jgi:ubiquinone/menaquinone biosynthesis C-methylase UbiE
MSDYDDVILKHYQGVAETWGQSSESTMLDKTVRQAEIDFIVAEVRRTFDTTGSSGRVFEIGVGNGYLMELIHTSFPSIDYTGIEFTPELLELALARDTNAGKATLGDCRNLDVADSSFDLVVSERVLINLLERDDILTALREAHRVIKPGGRFVFCEAFAEGLENLNKARREFCMDDIPPAHHNLYMDKEMQVFLEDIGFKSVDGALPRNYLSTHYFLSRFLHDIVRPEDGAIRNTEFVRFFDAALPSAIGHYSPIELVVLEKQA